MPKPFPQLLLLVPTRIQDPGVHLLYLHPARSIVWDVKLKSERPQLFELHLIYQHILVVGETDLECAGLFALEVVDSPYHFSLL